MSTSPRFRCVGRLVLALGAICLFEGAARALPHRSHSGVGNFRARLRVAGKRSDPARNSRDAGARLDQPVVARTDNPRPAVSRLTLSPSFYDDHADRVRRDLMLFGPDLAEARPLLRSDAGEEPPRSQLVFVLPARSEDPLDDLRARDRLLLFRQAQESNAVDLAVGLGLFTATTVMAAHAPRPMRLVFDRPIHLGPAILYGGGMGAGLGGRIP